MVVWWCLLGYRLKVFNISSTFIRNRINPNLLYLKRKTVVYRFEILNSDNLVGPEFGPTRQMLTLLRTQLLHKNLHKIIMVVHVVWIHCPQEY